MRHKMVVFCLPNKQNKLTGKKRVKKVTRKVLFSWTTTKIVVRWFGFRVILHRDKKYLNIEDHKLFQD